MTEKANGSAPFYILSYFSISPSLPSSILLTLYPSARGCQMAGVIPSARLYREPRTILPPPTLSHQNRTEPQARTFRANSSGSGTSSPPYLLPYSQPFSGRPSGSIMTGPTREAEEALRSGSGIVYPLQPRFHRPDTRITVDAALPQPAAFQRQDLPPTVVEIGSPIQSQKSPAARRRASRKPSRKRRRNRSSAVFRPAKRSPPRGHWCD